MPYFAFKSGLQTANNYQDRRSHGRNSNRAPGIAKYHTHKVRRYENPQHLIPVLSVTVASADLHN